MTAAAAIEIYGVSTQRLCPVNPKDDATEINLGCESFNVMIITVCLRKSNYKRSAEQQYFQLYISSFPQKYINYFNYLKNKQKNSKTGLHNCCEQ